MCVCIPGGAGGGCGGGVLLPWVPVSVCPPVSSRCLSGSPAACVPARLPVHPSRCLSAPRHVRVSGCRQQLPAANHPPTNPPGGLVGKRGAGSPGSPPARCLQCRSSISSTRSGLRGPRPPWHPDHPGGERWGSSAPASPPGAGSRVTCPPCPPCPRCHAGGQQLARAGRQPTLPGLRVQRPRCPPAPRGDGDGPPAATRPVVPRVTGAVALFCR